MRDPRAFTPLLLLAVLMIPNALVAPATAAPAAERPSDRPKIVFLGDSLTAGYGLEPGEDLPSVVGERLRQSGLDWQVVSAGVSGDTTAGGLRRIDWILRQKPGMVVVALGGNDMLRGIEPSATESNLDRILSRIRESGARPVLLGMRATPNLGAAYAGRFDSIYPRLARRHGVALMEFFIRSTALKPELNQPDGIHPTAEGVRRIAGDVSTFLLPLLREAPSR